MAGIAQRIALYREDDGTTHEVEWPLTAKVDLESMRKDLGVPEYVDMKYFPMQRAVVSLWAARNAQRLHELFPSVFHAKVASEPIDLALFGGGAIKLRCPSSNRNGAPFFRELNDLDLIAAKRHVREANRVFLKLGEAFGSQFIHFLTRLDKTFNALRVAKRFRYHVIDDVTDKGPVVGVLDLLVDFIEMRHRIDCRPDLNRIKDEHHTISLNNLLLSKCQYILEAPTDVVPKMEEDGQTYRILQYPTYRSGHVIVGMELKDLIDVSALIYDHEIGTGQDRIDPDRIVETLRRDEKMRLTIRLNLENLRNRVDILRSFGAGDEEIQVVSQRLSKILEAIPQVEKKFTKPWWEEAIDTPVTFWDSSTS